MGLLQRFSSIAPRRRMHASGVDYATAFFSGEDVSDSWIGALSAAGVSVTPELAMTLAAYACGVRTIGYDLATLPLETFKLRPDGGKDLIVGKSRDYLKGGIADLAYMMRWAPNNFQTASEFIASQVAQFLLRGVAYAEIVDGPNGAIAQLLPRHPDRVTAQRLPSGAMSYKLLEANGQPRYLTKDEMHVVRDISLDGGVTSMSRVRYGSNSIGTALAAEAARGRFFKSGMTAALMASYTGDGDDEYEKQLHKSISRYAAGVDNNFGLLVVPDDVKVSNLAIDPQKAQMMEAQQWTVFEVARHLNLSPRKLMVRTAGVTGYASAYQDAIDHVVGCIRPYARIFEQAMQRDLIIAKDTYFVKFNLRELLQGDPAQLAEFIEKAIASRAMRPSEARMLMLDLNPDEALDKLSEGDNRPGATSAPAGKAAPANEAPASSSADRATYLRKAASAVTCVRRERSAVLKLANKHASDVPGWKAALQDFYKDHATFVAETMGMKPLIAFGYVAEHGSLLEAQGVAVITAEWESHESAELAALALDHEVAA